MLPVLVVDPDGLTVLVRDQLSPKEGGGVPERDSEGLEEGVEDPVLDSEGSATPVKWYTPDTQSVK